MKRMLLLPVIFLISFIFSSCSTIVTIFYGSTIYCEYDFVNKKNKTVKRGEGKWDSPEIIMEGIKFFFGFTGLGVQRYGKDTVIGGGYYPWIQIRTPEGKYIEHILINNVVIYAGENEYNMLERLSSVSFVAFLENFSLTEEGKADIRRTGIIDIAVYSDIEDILIYTNDVFLRFLTVPIDFNKHKEIKMFFDISVKYSTGEIITINQELTGLLKKKRRPNYESIWSLTV